MKERICITLPSSGERICFVIPVFFPVKWWNPNPPDPLDSVGQFDDGPLPDPWIHGSSIKAEIGRDLRILATMHAVSELLSPGIREAVNESIRQHVKRLPLPSGIEVHFDQIQSKG